jgi:hypothetical protein
MAPKGKKPVKTYSSPLRETNEFDSPAKGVAPKKRTNLYFGTNTDLSLFDESDPVLLEGGLKRFKPGIGTNFKDVYV